MMHKPWDCAQPDEWLPQSLRLCWGGGGDGGGGGFSGDSGGGFTGGGDWGSSGSYDASGFNAGGDLGAWAGSAYDASVFGTGMGGGGDWGSFGDTNYGSFNAPNPTFADIAGPNPGVTTGGGDWGSAGTFSAAGTGGGPAGSMYGGGGNTGGGGLFGDYGGGGGGDYTGGGGPGGGGSFGGFGTTGTLGASNAVSSVSGPAFADTAGPGSLAGPAGQASSGAPTTSEAQEESAGPSEGVDPGGEQYGTEAHAPGGIEPGGEQFGTPAQTEDAPSQDEAAPTQDEAAPEVSSTIAGGRETNFDYGRQAETAPSHFGPESVTSQEGRQALSDLTQSALAPQEPAWGSVFEAPSDPGYQPDAREGPMGPIAEPGWFESLISDIPGVQTPAWAQDIGKSLTDVNTWLAPQNQGAINFLTSGALNPNNWVDVQSRMGPAWGPQSSAFDLQALGEQGKAGQLQDTFDSRFAIDPNTDTTNWGAVFEGATPPSEDVAPAIEAFIPGGRETDFTGYESLPGGAIQAFIPGGQETNFDYGTNAPVTAAPAPDAAHPYAETLDSGQPGAPPTTDDASTPGGDPALSGAAANATQGQPAVAPAAGGQTFVTDAAVNATVNAVSVALDKAGVDPITQDAVSQAVYDAALNLASPADQANAAATAALQTGASPAQAAAIANATYNVAMAQTAFTPGQPGQQQQAPPGEQQPGAPEGEQTTSTTSAFIPGQLQTNFEYAPSQPAPQSLIEQAQPAPPTPTPSALTPTTPAYAPPSETRPGDAPQGEPDHDEEGEQQTTPAPGRPLGAPTTRTQNTPVITARVRQEQQRGTRNRPVSEALHGILTRAAEHAGVIVRVGSGGQIATRSRADYRQSGGWTGSVRHNHGNAADVRLEKDGRILNYNNPQDRAVMEAFVREAARLGATGQGAGMSYMGPNTIHVGFGGTNFWRADNPGSLALRQAWREGLQGPANRPPADIPNVRTAQPTIPLPGRRPSDAPQQEAATPPPEVPVALPPQAPQETRPPADIPAPAPFLAPPRAGRADPALQARFANDLLKDATKNLNKNSGEAEFSAASVVGAKALAAAGIPLAMARSLMTQGAYAGAAKNGYDVNSFPMGGVYKSKIDGGIDAALQGYQPSKPGEVQGPYGFQPDAPGKQGALPSGQQYADLSQSLEAPSSLLSFLQNFNLGGQRGTSVVGNKVFTFYAPGASGAKGMEGPIIGSKGNPLTTLDDVRNGAGFVSLAGHPAQFGQQVFIGNVTYTSPVDGKQYTLNNVVGRVDDTGGKFGGRDNPDQNHFDIAVGNFSKGWNDRSAGQFVAGNYATAVPGRGIGSDYAADDLATAVGAQPPAQEAPMRGLAKGGHVAKDEPVVVGEEGPEYFVPDEPGTVVPHMPQPGKTGKSVNIDRWPKLPAPNFPGRYGGVEREILRQTREAQNPSPGLMDLIDSGQMRLNAANWHAMLNDPSLIALGRSRMDDRRQGIDPGAEQYGVFPPASTAAAEPPDPTNPMAQALGYGSIKRRPMQIGRQSY